MIIYFAGRKGSGKSLLCNRLIEKGFIKVSFADRLKELISYLYGCKIEDLGILSFKEKKLDQPWIFNKNTFLEIKDYFNIKTDFDIDDNLVIKFDTPRKSMQYIGTDLLRSIDPDFHVKHTIKKIKTLMSENKDICLDDGRYFNEKVELDKLGAIGIFVFRPKDEQYNNHTSEISLRRQMFDYVICNDKKISTLITSIDRFLSSIKNNNEKPISRNQLSEMLQKDTPSHIAKKLNCSPDKVIWWARNYLIEIKNLSYSMNEDVFSYITPESCYYAGLISADGCIKYKPNAVVELTSSDEQAIIDFKSFMETDKEIYRKKKKNGKLQYALVINSKKVLEDMKLWNLESKKSKLNKVPEILLDIDRYYLDFWLVGLIDGDGTVCVTKNTITIGFLASKEICEFISDRYKEFNFHISYNHKGIDNLCYIRCNSKNAINFYKNVYRGKGLARKWDKMKNLIKERNISYTLNPNKQKDITLKI